MGHVDHGKTSLLDRIRNSKVAAGEAGGITQHIAAYKVPAGDNHGEIVFLDTPGHEAFTEMRARGAQATDIVILVVAANDGVMPQTLEALSHAKDAKVPIIVAVNKVDLPDAQPDRIRQQLADHGLIPEEWGGDTQYVNVSALKGENIEKLLETIALIAEVAELKANPDKPATGVVIEARLDRNRGPMATILVQEGTLKVGDILVAGRCYGKVRAMLDARGETVKEAGPSTPVEILGLDGVPEAGDQVNVAEDDKTAKQVVEHRVQQWRKKELSVKTKVSLEGLMERMNEGSAKELKIVLKADVQGSAEALKAALVKLTTEKVRVNVIATGVGGITESDVNLAKAGGAIIVGFHVRPAGKSNKLAEQEGVQIRLYDIIYDCLDEVKSAMAGLLAPIKREQAMGKLEVRETFTVPKIGTVAGLPRLRGQDHPQVAAAGHPRRGAGVRGPRRLAASLQGRRQRGADRLRVRRDGRWLQRPQDGRRHRDLRGDRGGGDAVTREGLSQRPSPGIRRGPHPKRPGAWTRGGGVDGPAFAGAPTRRGLSRR
jgi:translation initiation factor IF-2